MLGPDLLAAHFAEKLAAQAGAVSERMNARPAHAEAADSPGTFSARRKNNRSQRHDLGSSPGLRLPAEAGAGRCGERRCLAASGARRRQKPQAALRSSRKRPGCGPGRRATCARFLSGSRSGSRSGNRPTRPTRPHSPHTPGSPNSLDSLFASPSRYPSLWHMRTPLLQATRSPALAPLAPHSPPPLHSSPLVPARPHVPLILCPVQGTRTTRCNVSSGLSSTL